MIKKIILGSFFLFSLPVLAQETSASPYSYYGVGETKFKGTVDTRAMGGIGILNDSIHINLQNPASLSALKLTTYTVAGTFTPTTLKTNTDEQKAKRTSLDYLAVAFPAGKTVFSLGLLPYSAVGYRISNLDVAAQKNIRYNGSGGMNSVFLGSAYKITNKFSVGAQFSYEFGKITKSAVQFQGVDQFGTREANYSELSGVNFNLGAIYNGKLNEKLDFVASSSFSPATRLNSSNTRNVAKVTYNNQGSEIIYDSQDVTIASTKIKLPTKFSFGGGIGESKKWFVGLESTFLGKPNYAEVYPKATFENATKLSLGGYYIPKYNAFSGYFQKVTYRAGFRHENTGIVIGSQSIKDTAFTMGLGLPLGGAFSNVNFGAEFGKKGTKNAGLVQENYVNITFGLSFNDRWFVKRKFD